jgi:magnesium-protoporphyrin O-methyltransferase
MNTTYTERRGELQTYFDRTAVEAWSRLTSDAPVSRIRATVRAGRDRMRATLLAWLPDDLRGRRVLDAGCGTGALTLELARRGAEVVAIDLSPTLIGLARERLAPQIQGLAVEFRVGDMLDPALGHFDHVVAMDSLIHYPTPDIVRALAALLAERTRTSMVCTFAPRTTALAVMHFVGRLFPKGDRAPAIEPVREATLRQGIASEPALAQWQGRRTQIISSGFYKSQALEICRRTP